MSDTYFAGAFNADDLEHAKHIVLTPDPKEPGKFNEETGALVDFILAYKLAGPHSTVLDFGCGMGRIAKALIEKSSCTVIGTDISPSMRMFAKRYVNDPRFKVFQTYTEPASVDLILAILVLQHAEEPEREIALFQKVLKSGGSIILLNGKKRLVPRDVDSDGFVVWKDDGVSVEDLMRKYFALQGFFPFRDKEGELSVWKKV